MRLPEEPDEEELEEEEELEVDVGQGLNSRIELNVEGRLLLAPKTKADIVFEFHKANEGCPISLGSCTVDS